MGSATTQTCQGRGLTSTKPTARRSRQRPSDGEGCQGHALCGGRCPGRGAAGGCVNVAPRARPRPTPLQGPHTCHNSVMREQRETHGGS